VERHTGYELVPPFTALHLNFTISGQATFVNDSPGNTCQPLVPTARIMFHQAGDAGTVLQNSYRWFSNATVPLAIGTFDLVVPLDPPQWVNVGGQNGVNDVPGFAGAKANQGSIGMGFGGGCFAAHGVAVSSGAAQVIINALDAQ